MKIIEKFNCFDKTICSNLIVQVAEMVNIRGGKIYSISNANGHFKPDNNGINYAQNIFEELPSKIFHNNFQGFIYKIEGQQKESGKGDFGDYSETEQFHKFMEWHDSIKCEMRNQCN